MNDDFNKLFEAIEQFSEHIYEATEIFIGNPWDLFEMDMSEIPSNCYFISDIDMERGVLHKTKGELKRVLYDFIENNPDRVFRGTKCCF